MSTPQAAVRIALAQFNATVGDLPGNAGRIVAAAREAHAAGAALLVTPELSLCGYPPEDLLLRPAFMQACARTLADLAVELAQFDGLTVVVGHPHQFGERGDLRSRSHAVQQRFNAASVLAAGKVHCFLPSAPSAESQTGRFLNSLGSSCWPCCHRSGDSSSIHRHRCDFLGEG